jgi:hypothetical protein
MAAIDDIVGIARDCPHADINLRPHPTDDLSEVVVTFWDRSEMVITPEESGYIWALWLVPRLPWDVSRATGGDDNLATLANAIRKLAGE